MGNYPLLLAVMGLLAAQAQADPNQYTTVAADPSLDVERLPPAVVVPFGRSSPPSYVVTPVDKISDIRVDPRTVYRDMVRGQMDREPMVEVRAQDYPALQLPEPTIVPADAPSSSPVTTVPAERYVEPELSGEDKIFEQIAGRNAPPAPKENGLKALRRLPAVAPRSMPRSPAGITIIDSSLPNSQ